MAFINYEKAFDSVETSVVIKILQLQGVKEIYVKILEDIYYESTAFIKLCKVSDKIPLQKGVTQGYFS